MHANWCFQSKCSNISAEGLHFSAFHLNEVMVGAINASWGRLFHIETVLGTNDD